MKPSCGLLFTCVTLLILFAPVCPQAPAYSVYTFKHDQNLKIGYPAGWNVQEQADAKGGMISAVITRSTAADSEGFIFFLIPYPKDAPIADSRQFSAIAAEQLKSNALPGLKLLKDYPHQSQPVVHVSELALDADGVSFSGRSWSALLKGEGTVVGLFAMFYAPSAAFEKTSVEEMLAGLIAPIFGGVQGAAPSQPAASAGGLDPRFFGTWALHTTVAANTMMQENTYNPDGTFVIRQFASGPMMGGSLYGSGSASQTLHGTWMIQDGLFHLRWQNGKLAIYRFSFSGNFVEMQGVNVKESLKFRKVDR